MEDKIYAPDFEAFLKKYSENRNYYEPDLLYDVIIKAEQKFGSAAGIFQRIFCSR